MHVKVLIAQTGSIDYVHKEYYERYKDEGIILIPEDLPKVELEEPKVEPEEEPEVAPVLNSPEFHKELMDSVRSTQVELPKKTRGRQKKQ